MNGTITRRGKSSWRLKFDIGHDPKTGERRIGYKTIRGSKKVAQRELRAILHRMDKGISIDPSKISVTAYLQNWLDDVAPQRVAPMALERYRSLVRNQVAPHLGTIQLQKLRPADIAAWHQKLVGLGKLSTRTNF